MKTIRTIIAIATLAIATSALADGPRNLKEAFPFGTNVYDMERRIESEVLLLVSGEKVSNFWIEDEYGRPAINQIIADLGSDVSINSKTQLRGYRFKLPPGKYTAKVWPFYYKRKWGFWRTQVVNNTPDSYPFEVTPDVDRYDSFTDKRWAAVILIDTGSIPQSDWTAPHIEINCTGAACDFLRMLGIDGGVVKVNGGGS